MPGSSLVAPWISSAMPSSTLQCRRPQPAPRGNARAWHMGSVCGRRKPFEVCVSRALHDPQLCCGAAGIGTRAHQGGSGLCGALSPTRLDHVTCDWSTHLTGISPCLVSSTKITGIDCAGDRRIANRLQLLFSFPFSHRPVGVCSLLSDPRLLCTGLLGRGGLH